MQGSELKTLRNQIGLSVAKAARQVEVSPRTWARWESGDQSIPDGAIKLFRIMNTEKIEVAGRSDGKDRGR